MFISEVQNKNALQRTLMSHRTMADSAQWPVGAVSNSLRQGDCPRIILSKKASMYFLSVRFRGLATKALTILFL